MKKNFINIEEFFGVKEQCVFCQSKLKIIFINFSRAADDIPIIKAKVKDGKFCFNMKHVTNSFELDAEIELDIKTNVLKFFIPNMKEADFTKVLDYWVAQQVFENLGPHVELYCSNRKCKMKYHICTDTFKLTRQGLPEELATENSNAFKIKYVRLYMESFVLSQLWVQNDWLYNSTNIFPKNNPNAEPIKTGLLDLESMSTDKIINRIKTLVTFS